MFRNVLGNNEICIFLCSGLSLTAAALSLASLYPSPDFLDGSNLNTLKF